MDTNLGVAARGSVRGKYKHHPLSFKRAVVEETLQPGASVARIARAHGINANQVFLWRKCYREGTLGDEAPALLPVTVEAVVGADPPFSGAGILVIEAGRLRIRFEGRPDPEALRLVIAELRR